MIHSASPAAPMDNSLPPGIAAMIAAQQQMSAAPPPASPQRDHMGEMEPMDKKDVIMPGIQMSTESTGALSPRAQTSTSPGCTYMTAGDCTGVEEAFAADSLGPGMLSDPIIAAGSKRKGKNKGDLMKDVPCPHCGKMYTGERGLKHHLKYIHKEIPRPEKRGRKPIVGSKPTPNNPPSPDVSGFRLETNDSQIGLLFLNSTRVQTHKNKKQKRSKLENALAKKAQQPDLQRTKDKLVPRPDKYGKYACVWGCDMVFASIRGAYGHKANCPARQTTVLSAQQRLRLDKMNQQRKRLREKARAVKQAAASADVQEQSTASGRAPSPAKDKRTFQCDLCPLASCFVTDDQFKLRQHRWLEHHSKHICKICSKASPDAESLATHMKAAHES